MFASRSYARALVAGLLCSKPAGLQYSKLQGKTTEACTAEASVAEVFVSPSWE